MDRIVIADDHPLFRAALVSALSRAAPGREVVETPSLQGAREALAAGGTAIGLLLLDLKLSDSDGFAGLTGIRADYPAVPVAVVSASEDARTVRRALAFGASGFIPKSADLDQMVLAISAVLEGETWTPEGLEPENAETAEMEARIASLTPSQLRILVGLKKGRLNKQIAWDLGVTEATIKAHLTGVFRKLGVHNRTQAVIAAQSLELEG
ncbi:response regulator [Brevundimonas sp. VNH65]|uniref:response regulator n=1 Tax=Brevundimonas sp. VNH65 TaxID=3400917 RepID=UPI003BFAC40B